MPTYQFTCSRCGTQTDEMHAMRAMPAAINCPACGATAPRDFVAPNFSAKGDDLNGGEPQYCPALARRMPYGRNDPKAYFTSKRKARDAAKRKADSQEGYTLHLD